MFDIKLFERHGNRLLGTIRGKKNKSNNPRYMEDEKRILPLLKALCCCHRLPNLLQLVVSNTGSSALDRITDVPINQPSDNSDGFAAATTNFSFDAKVRTLGLAEEADEKVLP